MLPDPTSRSGFSHPIWVTPSDSLSVTGMKTFGGPNAYASRSFSIANNGVEIVTAKFMA